MTQIFGYHTPHTILLATDSLALCPDPKGGWERKTVRKIVHLSPSVVLLSGGAGIGLALAHRFADVVRSQGLWDVESIFPKALPFVRAQAPLIKDAIDFSPPPATPDVHRYYILLSGMSLRSDPPSARWMLIGAESAHAQVERIAIGSALAVPRHMGFEVRASRLAGTEEDLHTVEQLMGELLQRRAAQSQDAAPPYVMLRINADGIREWELP